MKKTWIEASIEALDVNLTANGLSPSDDFDDTWVQIGGLYYRPGHGRISD